MAGKRLIVRALSVCAPAIALVALSGFGALGGPRSEPGPAGSTSPAPDAVGVAVTSYPAALFPDSRMPSGELDLLAAEGPEAKPIFTPPPKAPAPSPIITAPSTGEVAAARVQEQGGSLTEAEMRAVLTEAGWPVELHDAALRVAWCESRWSPHAHGDGGNSLGLFQLNVATWFRYAGEDPALWADPLVNARTALATYYYDLGRGYEPWKQWSCKP